MTTIEVPSNGALFWATHRRQGRTGPMRCTKLLGNRSARLIPTHREHALSHLTIAAEPAQPCSLPPLHHGTKAPFCSGPAGWAAWLGRAVRKGQS